MSDGRRLLDDPRARAGRRRAGGCGVAAAVLAPLLAGDPYLQRDIVATRFLSPLVTDSHGSLSSPRHRPLRPRRLGAAPRGRARLTRCGRAGDAHLRRTGRGGRSGRRGSGGDGSAAALLAVTDFALALPRVVLLLLLASLWQPSAVLVILVLGFTGWMPIARLVYGEVRALAVRPFVERRDRTRRPGHAGAGPPHPPQRADARHGGRGARARQRDPARGGLSFLGLGVQPPAPSWGNLIASGRDTLVNAPWVAAAPGVALVLVVVAATLLGDAVRDRLAPAGRRP